MKDYAKQCERQVNNTENQKYLQKDSTATNNELAHNVIKRFGSKTLIQKSIAKGLKINSLQTPRFYTEPKIRNKSR